MDQQIIITVGREFGSGGHEIARQLAEQLNLHFYDRSMLDEVAKATNVEVEFLEKYDEKPRKLFGSRRVGAFSNSMEEIIAELQFENLRQKAESGESFVIVGRCAESVLKDVKGLISVFILGDLQEKVKRIQERYQLDEQEALFKLKRHDKKRKQYHNFHAEGKWGDSRTYDICINSSRLGIEKTVELLKCYVEERIRTF